MLSRQKARDFYDAMFLLAMSEPDYSFSAARLGIHNLEELKAAVVEMLKIVDLNIKKRDFEHLLFNTKKCESILAIGEFIRKMK